MTDQLADELESLAKEAHVASPWRNENPKGWVWGPSEKGGDTHILDIRGWGYLTGNGSGGLGLPLDEAHKRYDATGDLVVALVNNLPAILSALREREVLREALKPFDAVAENYERWKTLGTSTTPADALINYGGRVIRMSDCIAARAALQGGGE